MPDPLYVQAHKRTLGPFEFMDEATLDWIRITSAQLKYPLKYVYLESSDLKLLRRMLPVREWFFSNSHSKTIHGIAHCIRVMLFSAMLSKMLDGAVSTPYILTAAIHDTRRLNDNEDSEHGNRAAQWFVENEQLKQLYDFDKNQLELIHTMVSCHHVEYDQIDPLVLKKYRRPIDIIKAADALDRFRMPKESWWPQPEKIALKQAHNLLGFSRELTLLSEMNILSGSSPQEAIFNAYIALTRRKDITLL